MAAELKSLLHGDFSRLAAELYILKKKGFAESRYQGLGTDNAGLLARLRVDLPSVEAFATFLATLTEEKAC